MRKLTFLLLLPVGVLLSCGGGTKEASSEVETEEVNLSADEEAAVDSLQVITEEIKKSEKELEEALNDLDL